MEPFAPATQWVIVVFMLVAGTNFALLFAGIVGRRPRLIARDEEVRVGLLLLVRRLGGRGDRAAAARTS